MTVDWGGAQWVLAVLWVIRWMAGPVIRMTVGGDVVDAWTLKKTQERYEKSYATRWLGGVVLADIPLLGILLWGGFW